MERVLLLYSLSQPQVENQAFQEKYKDLNWNTNVEWLQAWKDGKTGFPIVDAGMRELKTTGWMHNRVRMIVASFLTKDLHIDWREGEAHFMHELLDGDLACNNGGWQWAASTGCDAQPYFRIFNPWSQSKKFDPDGEYIKKFVPELKDVPAKQLHEPIVNHSSYPAPLVDHSVQREKTLEMFKSLK
ncbi:MAG: FAD-binding domain-containing protein [Bdellovibrionales bacterium]